MVPARSNRSSRRLGSRAALAALALLVGRTSIHPPTADACAWDGPDISLITTFDPSLADDGTAGLRYDPYYAGFGGPCDDCARTAMTADWSGYLGGTIAASDWEQILLRTPEGHLVRVREAVQGSGTAPPGLEPIVAAAAADRAVRARVLGALEYVALARRIEPIASLEAAPPSKVVTEPLFADALAGLRAAQKAKDPFLAQRFAFLRLRAGFYARDWAGVVTYFDKNASLLSKPSADLAARARYYAAGALRKRGALARSNLELARVHAASPALAGVAAQDFQPMEDADWRASLAAAKGPHDRVLLWRMVGLRHDGLVAAQEIAKLEPTSPLLAVLVVRELARVEQLHDESWGAPDAATRARAGASARALEALAVQLAATPRADRAWLMNLVAGHLAARRGDVAAARTYLGAATSARAGDARVTSQAQASLAVALAHGGKLAPGQADELARTVMGLQREYARLDTVTRDVRSTLAKAALADGKLADAELLYPGTAPGERWADPAFIRQLIDRTAKNQTEFDRFLLSNTHTRADLESELAYRDLIDGRLDAAVRTLERASSGRKRLGTDPFAMNILDCHDCDHARFASASWTRASVARRMASLAGTAGGKGDPAAKAALSLGHAYYNLSWHGNARMYFGSSHQTADPALATRWYKRAHDLATSRELKARAAFFAAKAELAVLIDKQYRPYESADVLPVPATWFPVLKSYADTRYYKEVLRECGHFRAWSAR